MKSRSIQPQELITEDWLRPSGIAFVRLRDIDDGLFYHQSPQGHLEALSQLQRVHGWVLPLVCAKDNQLLYGVRELRAHKLLIGESDADRRDRVPVRYLDVQHGPPSWIAATRMSGHLPELKLGFIISTLVDRGFSYDHIQSHTGFSKDYLIRVRMSLELEVAV